VEGEAVDLLIIQAAAASSGGATTPLWVTVAVGVAGAAATLLAALGGAIGNDRSRRRENHAAAVRTLLAWHELPYQIRRRLTDEDEEIARLRDLGHALQQDLAYHEALLRSENAHLGRAYSDAKTAIKEATRDAIAEAWQAPPADRPDGQVLNGWGPGAPADALQTLLHELPWRFGLRRAFPRWARGRLSWLR
jgi:hypothetical protein